MLLRRTVSTTSVLYKMPAPKKRKDGPKQVKKPPPPPKLTMLEVKNRYLEELPPLPYTAYPDERCFLEEHKRVQPLLSEEEYAHRQEMEKEHSRFMNQYWREARQRHKKQVALRNKALLHLQAVDAELYSAAITFNFDQFPNSKDGLRNSLPNPRHLAPLKVESKVLESEESVGTNAWLDLDAEKQEQFRKKKKQGSSSVAASVKL